MIKKLLTLLLGALATSVLFADNHPVERIFISTDREVYIAGDVVFCSLFCLDSQALPSNSSAVSYLELVSTEGTVTEAKIGLLEGRGAGSFRIPVSTPTGVYRLVAYTSGNVGEDGAPWIAGSRLLTIFNTLSVSRVKDGVFILDEAAYQSLKSFSPENAGQLIISSPARSQELSEYTIFMENGGTAADFSLSVYHEDDIVPVKQENSMAGFLASLPSVSTQEYTSKRQIDYDGEIIYARISGKKTEDTGNAVATLSSAGAPSNMYIGVTEGEMVRFLTNNIYGDREIVCEVSNMDLETGSISIESPFIGVSSSTMPKLPMSKFIYKDLSSRKAALKNSMAVRLDTLTTLMRHREDLLLETAAKKHIHLDDFTRFPSIQEVLVEIIPMLSLRRTSNGLKLTMTSTDGTGSYKATVDNLLVMMDGVVISDFSTILDFDAMLLEDVDIYTQAIACGKVSFDGAVNFITKKNYVTALSFPANVKVVDFKGVSFPVAYYGERPSNNVEDLRELLYWDPTMRLSAGEKKRLVIHTPGYQGRFKAVVDGLTEDGSPIHYEWTFTVE